MVSGADDVGFWPSADSRSPQVDVGSRMRSSHEGGDMLAAEGKADLLRAVTKLAIDPKRPGAVALCVGAFIRRSSFFLQWCENRACRTDTAGSPNYLA